jgi:DNA-binding CsgD family transcriptional regulator
MPSPQPREGVPGIRPTTDEIAATRARETRVVELALAGKNGVQIAQIEGIDKGTVSRIISRVFARDQAPKVAEMRNLWNLRIERALTAIWDKLLDGDVGAVHAFCRLEERAARLWGLDQQTARDADALAEALLTDPAARRERGLALVANLEAARARAEDATGTDDISG